MTQFDAPSTKLTVVHANLHPLLDSAHSLYREAEMITLGVGSAVVETAKHPLDKLPELGASLPTGTLLGTMSRLGASGKVVAAGIGTAMLVKFGYDELTGNRWSTLAGALKDSWHSDSHMKQNIAATKNSLGSFLVDTGIGAIGMKFGSLATAHIAPPAALVKYAIRRADTDGGAALLSLQNRWEDPVKFQKHASGKLELITHTEPAVPGSPRGDLVRVATDPDGKLLIAAMDVEGHGVSAAKKAVTVHAAIDEILPQTGKKPANDILSMLDQKLGSKDELAITAALAKYDPLTHRLETATASSEYAYVVRADGTVHRLDEEVGGQGLGTNMYTTFERGNEVTHLNQGDTVVLTSDGVFDRFGFGNKTGFETFLKNTGPSPAKIRQAILNTPLPAHGADDSSFIIFQRH